MPKSAESIVEERWKDEVTYIKFRVAFNRKFKQDINNAEWKGKDKGSVHPLFERWLISGKL